METPVSLDVANESLAVKDIAGNDRVCLTVNFPQNTCEALRVLSGRQIQPQMVAARALKGSAFRVEDVELHSVVELNVAIAASNQVPPIFGREDALDRFSVTFHFGETLIVATA